MSGLTLSETFGLLAVSLAASLLVLWLMGRIPSGVRRVALPAVPSNTFLFNKDALVDHDVDPLPASLREADAMSNWADLCDWFDARFVGLPHSLSELDNGTALFHDSLDTHSGLRLQIKRNGPISQVIILAEHEVSPAAWHCANLSTFQTQGAQKTLDAAPFPIWKTDASGGMTWCNNALNTLETELGSLPQPVSSGKPAINAPRFSIPGNDQQPDRWFEVTSHPMQGSDTLHIATAIDQVIKAETTQRAFLQTLTKTFANLTTGLAVFDKNRQLALFNPALVDLTGISVSFLSARPDVIRFFDELRERQVLPEPKNYASLRSEIREVIAKAHDGDYLEIWNLPGGVTYRVTGRPHPDGAVAFLIEDISIEVSKTRQFRTQIDLGQSVIDGLDEAIAVIAPNNTVLLCNAACSEMLQVDPANSFVDVSLDDLVSICRDKFNSDALWAIFEAGLRNSTLNADGPERFLNARSGQRFAYQIKPLSGGVRMIKFSRPIEVSQSMAIPAAE